MKKQLKKWGMTFILSITMTAMFVGCGKTEEKKETVEETKKEITITLMNGEVTLGTVTAMQGETVTGYEQYEILDGYEFLGWFEAPSFVAASEKKLATDIFEEDTTLYGSFKKANVSEDTRTWTIVGTGSSEALAASNWNNNCRDSKVTFQATGENVNEFAMTVDLFAGDQFQVIHDYDWADQRGYAWFTDLDETMFENGGSLGGSSKTANINVVMDGNYTITLVTDPDDSTYDSFTIVRNGEVLGTAAEKEEEVFEITEKTQVVVKGSWVADWSDHKELTRVEGTDTYTIEMELEAGTELYFMIWEDGTDTGLGLKGENVTEDLDELVDTTNNVAVKETGTYTFTVDLENNSIKVSQ